MKNFLRALRHAWPYRRRLVVSVVCAVFAAVLWGLNFTSIYPVLKLLHENKSPQELVDDHLHALQGAIDRDQAEVRKLTDEKKELIKKPANPFFEQKQRDLDRELY